MLVGIEGLTPQRQLDRRVVQAPNLRPRDLQDKYVVTIEVRLETLRVAVGER